MNFRSAACLKPHRGRADPTVRFRPGGTAGAPAPRAPGGDSFVVRAAPLWFLDRLEGPSATYNIPVAVRLSGALDAAALEAALGDLVERHESLRTIFPDNLGSPRQLILEALNARPTLKVLPVTEATLAEALAAAAQESFDLTRRSRCAFTSLP